jgi:hypothetical protein
MAFHVGDEASPAFTCGVYSGEGNGDESSRPIAADRVTVLHTLWQIHKSAVRYFKRRLAAVKRETAGKDVKDLVLSRMCMVWRLFTLARGVYGKCSAATGTHFAGFYREIDSVSVSPTLTCL